MYFEQDIEGIKKTERIAMQKILIISFIIDQGNKTVLNVEIS